jgi:hypothetical protein
VVLGNVSKRSGFRVVRRRFNTVIHVVNVILSALQRLLKVSVSETTTRTGIQHYEVSHLIQTEGSIASKNTWIHLPTSHQHNV